MEANRNPDEIALLLRRAGVRVSAEQLDEIARVAHYIDGMIARVRAAEADDAPAHVFSVPEPGR